MHVWSGEDFGGRSFKFGKTLPVDSCHTFLHDAFDVLEQARVLLVDPVRQVASIIQNLKGNKAELFINATFLSVVVKNH